MQPQVVIFGEVLMDVFPDGNEVLGGAPFNVAWHLQAFGLQPKFVSRVGNDDAGRKILGAMREWGMDVSDVQTDADLPTGRVEVTLHGSEPSYEIIADCAYDAIDFPAHVTQADLLYHGTLAVREPGSAAALQALIAAASPQRVLMDVNLRAPWYKADAVTAAMRRADWVKLNAAELSELVGAEDSIEAVRSQFGLQGLIVTHGSAGAEVCRVDEAPLRDRPPVSGTVVDTVGAGDAFTSVILLGLALGWPSAVTLQRALAFGSAIVGQRGAIVRDIDFYRRHAQSWSLPALD